jgi:hypothetical protein
MSDTYYSLKCPVCRTHNFQSVETLPVNYALLDLATDDREICEQHQLEIVGFCRDDEMLLCGACVFEHRSHASFVLNSPEAKAWADSKKKLLEQKESSLKLMQSKWEKANASLRRHISNLNSEAKAHIDALKRTEAKLIEAIREGTQECLSQIKEVVENRQLKTKQHVFTERLQQVSTELSRINSLRQNFEQASVIERLRGCVDLEEEPPSVEDCKPLLSQLKVEADYDVAIKTCKFPVRD